MGFGSLGDGSILVLNAGSSSLKFAVFAGDMEAAALLRGAASGLGDAPHLTVHDADGRVVLERSWPDQQSFATLLHGPNMLHPSSARKSSIKSATSNSSSTIRIRLPTSIGGAKTVMFAPYVYYQEVAHVAWRQLPQVQSST